MHIAVRICLPDHLGSLAEVAEACGRAGANIETLYVVERDEGYAVDDICVEHDAPIDLLRQALETVPGVVVEAMTPVPHAHDPRTTTDLAVDLIGDPVPLSRLISDLPGALWATWAVMVERDHDGSGRVIAGSLGAPMHATFDAPWMPLEAVRSLKSAGWMPSAWRFQASAGRLHVAVAPLGTPDRCVMVGREWAARFRPTELHQLDTLCRMATYLDHQPITV